MCQTPTRSRKPLTAVKPEWRWLRTPCWPCVLAPAGFMGILEIDGAAYGVTPLSEYPAVGYRLQKQDGTLYDIDAQTAWGGWSCDCPDGTYRPERPGGCRHIVAVREAVASLFVD